MLAKDGPTRRNPQNGLKEKKVLTAVYYPRPLHLQTAFADLGYKAGDLPMCEDAASRIFSLLMHPYLTSRTQQTVADTINETMMQA